ncbi:MAG: tetratricopeptide repeat protein [Deltaproteobacteria bacterium]|nr:tetratricopeptide repeat protein [Deltaproteobacteria bacterium]
MMTRTTAAALAILGVMASGCTPTPDGLDPPILNLLESSVDGAAGPGPCQEAEDLLRKAAAGQAVSPGALARLARFVQHTCGATASQEKNEERKVLVKQAYEGVLRREPANVAALSGLAFLFQGAYHDPEQVYALNRRLLDARPEDPRIMLEVSKAFIWLDRADEAETILLKAISTASSSGNKQVLVETQEYLGRLYVKTGRHDEAEKILKSSIRNLEETEKTVGRGSYYGCPYQALGALYTRQGKAEKAAVQYGKAGDQEAGDPLTQVEAALGFYVVGEFDKAIQYVERAVKLQDRAQFRALLERLEALERGEARPVDGDLALDAAGLCFDLGDVTMARRLLEGSRTAEPGAGRRALSEKIRLAIKDGKGSGSQGDGYLTYHRQQESTEVPDTLAAAVRAYDRGDFALAEKVLERVPDGEDRGRKQVMLGLLLLLQQNYEKAEAAFVKARAQDPDDPGIGVSQGHLAIARRDYTAAEESFRPVVDAPPPPLGETGQEYGWLVYEMAHLGMAWVAANNNRHVDAIGHYDVILERQADDVFALLGKGNSLSGLRRMEEAEKLFRKVLDDHPDNPYALAELALVQYNRGEDVAAEKGFKSALAVDDMRYTCPYEGLGLIYLRQGRMDEARKNFERAIAINPHIEYKKYNGLARIHIKNGDLEKARKLLKKSISNYPHDPEAREMLKGLEGKR